MRIFGGEEWANLRLSTFSSYVAGTLATYKGVSTEEANKVRSRSAAVWHRLETCALCCIVAVC